MVRMDEAHWLVKNDQSVVTLHQDFPVFSIAEFNLIAACTRRCAFCPVSDPNFYKSTYGSEKNKYLPPELFKKVLGDLQAIGYSGEISFSGFSEPLLHPHREKLLACARAALPAARIQMLTNGDRLDVDTLNELFGAGLDELVISLYDGPEQIEKFEALRKQAAIPEDKLFLRRRYYDGTDYGVFISNRGGLVDVENFGRTRAELPLERKCFYPFSFVKVDLNGDVMFCPHNWAKKSLVGNVKSENLWDIWRNSQLEAIRESLSQKRRTIPSCIACDVDGTKTGEQSYLAWKNTRTT